MSATPNWLEQLRQRRHSGAARVVIRVPAANDRDEFLALMRNSEQLHRPWIFPPLNAAAYDEYLRRVARDDHSGFLVCHRTDRHILGVINLNNIVRGAFLSASLGYYAGAPFAGSGYMHEGLLLVAQHAFEVLRLHRIEANIQPANERSKALVRACGFRLEGLSPAYLYIDGGWRDHERWTLIDHREALY